MNIFVICSVRGADDAYRKKLEEHVAGLEKAGHKVHLPHRDTNQDGTGINICTQNMHAIRNADMVHVFYSSTSQGGHFDLGVAFSMRKPITIIENGPITEGKSFPRMLVEWSKMYANVGKEIE